MRNWSRVEIDELIYLVQQNECIYNVKSREYLDRTKKAQVLNNIAIEMQKMDKEINVEEIRRKWKNLRTQFMQEVREIKTSKKSGSGVADVYRPKLWCFDQLSFLESHIKTRTTVDNIKFTTDDTASSSSSVTNCTIETSTAECTEDDNDSSQNTSVTQEPPEKKQKKSEAIQYFRKDLDSVKNILSSRKKEKKFAWLGALVVETMEGISPEDRDDAAWQVQCLMRKLKQESQRKQTSSTSSIKDILELSLEGIIDEDDVM